MDDKDFEAMWSEAKAAAQAAAEKENAQLGDENSRGLDCGFAWLTMPGNIPFARWAKKQGLAKPAHPTGFTIWYTQLHSVPTQSVSVHEVAANAALEVIFARLGESRIRVGRRLD